ncbi:hypothetical protein D3M71_03605 [Erwinia billingiae]|nr:hypothetical protein [Erwinia billingiae]
MSSRQLLIKYSCPILLQFAEKKRIRIWFYKARVLSLADIFHFVEAVHNRAWRHSNPGYISPEAFEQVSSCEQAKYTVVEAVQTTLCLLYSLQEPKYELLQDGD